MKFLKIISAIALVALIVILLNNLMGFVFPVNSNISYNSYDDSYKNCQKYYDPRYVVEDSGTAKGIKEKNTLYQECFKKENIKRNDAQAQAFMGALIKAVVVFVLMVVISILIFKRYPYFSAAIVLSGIIFLVDYPLIIEYGYGLGSYNEISTGVAQQLKLVKFLLTTVGIVALSLADLLFFEKYSKNNLEESTQPNLNSNNNK